MKPEGSDSTGLQAVAAELRRLKSEGVQGIYLSDATWAALDSLSTEAAIEGVASVASETREKTATVPKRRKPEANTDRETAPAEAVGESGSLLLDYLSNEDAAATPAKKRPKKRAPVAAKKSGTPPGIAPIPEPPAFDLPAGDKRERWEWLRERVLTDPVCHEHKKPHCQVVFGVGSLEADIFFCGEAPGQEEEIRGEPFVGPAGQLLTKIIGAMGLSREAVYIGNIMNWRPETGKAFGNRPPTAVEMAYCLPYIRAQLAIVQPKLIVALGNTAVSGFLGEDPSRTMGKVRGTVLDFEGTPLVPTYHPSYLLRNQSNTEKRKVWEDMLIVMEQVGLSISEKQRGYFQ
ncbi:MAG: uracil-DNA glycosylase [Opitutales bacterium]